MAKKFNELTSEEKRNGCLGMVVLIVITFLVIKACEYEPAITQEQMSNMIEVYASKLAYAYQENEIQADHDYKDKVLSVSGTIAIIDNVGTGEITLRPLNGDYKNYVVTCSLENKEVALNKKIGDEIVLDGICKGLSLSEIRLTQCKIHQYKY